MTIKQLINRRKRVIGSLGDTLKLVTEWRADKHVEDIKSTFSMLF